MTLRPGTMAARAEVTLSERAMSSARATTRDDFVPRAGSSSNSVTTGPGLISRTSPLIEKSASTSSSRRAVPRSTDWVKAGPALVAAGRRRRLSDGGR